MSDYADNLRKSMTNATRRFIEMVQEMQEKDDAALREQVIRMAREAGLLPLLDEGCFQTMGTKNFGATKKVLERFAALAAAANAECATKTMPFLPVQIEEIEEMSKDTSGPAFPADIPRINTVKSLSPAPVTLDAIRRIVREEIRADAALEAAARQALERLRKYHHGHGFAEDAECIAALEAALKEEA